MKYHSRPFVALDYANQRGSNLYTNCLLKQVPGNLAIVMRLQRKIVFAIGTWRYGASSRHTRGNAALDLPYCPYQLEYSPIFGI